MSPELGIEVTEGDNAQLNVPYEIVDVDSDVNTEVRSLSGIRVQFLSADAEEATVMLWKRQVTGQASKLGSFISLLGSNTDHWLHKWVIFRSWVQGGRKVELSSPPIEKSTEATTAEGIEEAIKEG